MGPLFWPKESCDYAKKGKVKFIIEYNVDLDNQKMVDDAIECIFEDLTSAYIYNESFIDYENDDTLKESDIPEFLLKEKGNE